MLKEEKLRITLKAARVNADMNQQEAASELSRIMGIKVGIRKIIAYENHPEMIPQVFGEKLAEIYHIPIDNIFFGKK